MPNFFVLTVCLYKAEFRVILHGLLVPMTRICFCVFRLIVLF